MSPGLFLRPNPCKLHCSALLLKSSGRYLSVTQLKAACAIRTMNNEMLLSFAKRIVDIGLIERLMQRPRADQAAGPLPMIMCKWNMTELTEDAAAHVRTPASASSLGVCALYLGLTADLSFPGTLSHSRGGGWLQSL
jgi:hypothetical protein